MPAERDHVLNVIMNRKYPSVVRGEGVYLYNDEGKRYLDACGGTILVNLGHGVKEMAEALRDQAERIAFAYRMDFTSPKVKELAARLCEATGGLMDKVCFVWGGSESTEIAVKLARKYQIDRGMLSKSRVISRWQSYHGGTNGALSWSGFTSRRADFLPYLRDFTHIPPPYCYRCWYGLRPETCDLQCATALENEILCEGPETVSAFIAEPVSGTSLACVVPPKDYFPRIRAICDRYDVLLILDEVMTGMGCTGKLFAYEHLGVKPDIMTLGKGISGGYFPLAAVMAQGHITDAIATKSGVFGTGFSWAGNPLGCAVGLKALEYLQQHDLVNRCAQIGEYLASKLQALKSHPTVGDIRGIGLMRGVEFVKDKVSKETIDPRLHFSHQLFEQGMQYGIVVQPSTGCNRGQSGDMILLGPPFIITKAQVDELMEGLDRALTAVEKRNGLA